MISWTPIAKFVEPEWDLPGTTPVPLLFWRPSKKAATFGFIRDGELFDANWLYVCDSNKVTHFAMINGPE
ncbi:MAG: hypothetical protein ABL894_01460 [Hyphomicrobium sp.]